MSENNVHPVEGAEDVSPELKDLLDNPSETPAQPDTPEAGTEEKPDDTNPGEGTEKKPEDGGEKPGEEKPGEDNKPDDKKPPKQPDNLNPDDQEYEVAGKKYKSFPEAVAAVKSIAGDNTRITGDNIRLSNAVVELQRQRDEAIANYNEALRVNKEWQEYFQDPDHKEAPSLVKEQIKEVLHEVEEEKVTKSKTQQFQTEIDALPNEPDYKEVFPVFEALVAELGDTVKKVSPAKLWKMARGVLEKAPPEVKPLEKKPDETPVETPDDKKPLGELSKKIEKSVATRKEAAKVIGGGGANVNATPEDVSPELADYLEQH